MKKSSSIVPVVIVILFILPILLEGCTLTAPINYPTETPIVFYKNNADEITTPISTLSNISGQVVYTAVVSRDPYVTQIFLKDLDTNKVTQLTHSGNNSMPQWSPDGAKIVFLSWSQEESYDIYIMNTDGTNSQPLVSSVASESLPDWSPSGNKIVFESDKDGSTQIYVINLDSLEIKKLTNDLVGVSSPNWSTDGKRIVFTANTGISGRSQIFIVDADGTNLQQVTNYDIDNFDSNPVWCPDDTCVIFSRFVNGVPKLMLLNLATKEVSPFLQDVFADNLQENGLARSQSTKHITFSVGGTFYAININTGELFALGIIGLSLSLYP